jgi:hypothetical protein
MKTWALIRVYKLKAPDWWSATVAFRRAEEESRLDELKVYDRVKLERPKGFWDAMMKQLFG